jgi:hypothetical protein
MAKPFVFVMIPFANEFNDVYKLGIKAAAEECGAYCERVDEQHYDGRILDRIYNQINKADIIVADMTGRNPNVFYEVGYAHASNRRVILLVAKAEDIPFDLMHHPHIIYSEGISTLKTQLIAKLQWHLENPEKKSASNALKLCLNGNDLVEGNNNVCVIPGTSQRFFFNFKIVNGSNRIFSTKSQVGIIVTSSKGRLENLNGFSHFEIAKDAKDATTKTYLKELLPHASLSLSGVYTTFEDGFYPDVFVRLYQEEGYIDYKLTFKS